MLKISNVSRVYQKNRLPAVKALSVNVESHDLLALVGESGSGKTTLLRMIAGLEVPDSGEIRIGDRMVAGPDCWVPPEKRNVGMVFQGGALFPHLTVKQNIAYGLPNLSKAALQSTIEEYLELVGLSGAIKMYPHELSTGERQRVALARALAPMPKIILLDEPFSNLDALLKHRLREEVQSIIKAKKITGLMVTHDPNDARHFGDQVAIMRGGIIEQYGSVEAVVKLPCNEYCARLMGC